MYNNLENLLNKIVMTEFISLYDYLGRAAGKELGKQVAEYAFSSRVPHEIRQVSNPGYTGPIMLYPKAFLELYFKVYNA
jgi:hypothetical protein